MRAFMATAVLDAIYACYAEGRCDPAGTDPQRRNLADEALWLGDLVASLLPDEPEALGLRPGGAVTSAAATGRRELTATTHDTRASLCWLRSTRPACSPSTPRRPGNWAWNCCADTARGGLQPRVGARSPEAC